MSSSRLFLTFLLTTIFFSGCVLFRNETTANTQLLGLRDHSILTVQIKNTNVKVEVVNTSESTEQGLSGREAIGSDGMLFAFGELGTQRFWMKEMQFNLDLIWLRDLKVVDISENVPMPVFGQTLGQLPFYTPKTPVNEVLEVPAGTAQKWQLKIGDSFSLAQ